MTACPKTLPPLNKGDDAVTNHIQSARLYQRCRNKVAGWIDWYRSTEGK